MYLGKLRGEVGGEYPLYQCRECGTTFEMFSGGKYAAFYPEWTEKEARASVGVTFVKDRFRRSKPATRVLGKGLVEIQASQTEHSDPDRGLGALFRGASNGRGD